jgi:hypothetical protein
MRIVRFFLCFATLTVLAGCSGTIRPNYVPASSVRGAAKIQLGDVLYESAKIGRAKPNQVENTAAGSIYLDTTIEEYVKRAYVQEIEHSGFGRGADALKLDVTIHRLLADDLGYTVAWTLDETMALRDAAGKEMVKKRITVKDKTGKVFVSQKRIFGAMNGLVTRAYEQFFEDPDVVNIRDGR